MDRRVTEATGNSHDQYFFRRPELMVAGSVSLPRLDLANEDLLRAHVHAVWLAATEQFLGNSLTEILDVEGQKPTLDLLPGPRASLTQPSKQHGAERLIAVWRSSKAEKSKASPPRKFLPRRARLLGSDARHFSSGGG